MLYKFLLILLELIILLFGGLLILIIVTEGLWIGPINLMKPYISLIIFLSAGVLRAILFIKYNIKRFVVFKNPIYLLLIIFLFITSLLIINNYVAYVTFDFSNFHDLALYNQAMFNFVHGRGFADPVWGKNLFGDHSEIILVPLSLVYIFWQSPLWLLFIQTVTITTSVFPLYFLAKRKIGNVFWAVIICLNYLTFSEILKMSVWTEFRPIIFVIPILFTAFYFYDKDKRNIFVALILLTTLVKEEVSLVAAAIGLYIIFFNRRRKINYKTGLILFFAGIAIFFFMIKIFIPFFGGAPYPHFVRFIGMDKFFSLLLENPLMLFTNSDFFNPEKIRYLFDLFLKMGFAPIFSLLFLVPLSNWAQIIFSENASVISQVWHNALIIVFMFISLVFGIYNLKRTNKVLANIFLYILLLTTIFLGFPTFKKMAIMPLKSREVFIKTLSTEKYNNLKTALQLIPKNNSIYTTFKILPYVSSREKVFWYPKIIKWSDADYIIFTPKTFLNNDEEDKLKEGLKSDIFIKLKEVGEFEIWKKY